jgi:hypothetical protein
MPVATVTRWILPVALAVLAVVPGGNAVGSGVAPKPLPAWAEVRKTVLAHFDALRDYQPGAIIVQSEVRGVFKKLDTIGWRVADEAAILKLVPADNEFLATALRTPAGRRFMRDMCRLPHGYDQLDRLSRLIRGHTRVEELIRGPDGYKVIEYMTTSRGGKGLAKELSKAPNGADFGKPTGRIYTAADLLARLEASYLRSIEGSGGRK